MLRLHRKFGCLTAILAVALVLFTACPQDQPPTTTHTVNLIPLHQFGRQLRETGLVNLSTPFATWYLLSGWTHPYNLPDGGAPVVAATSQESVFRYGVIRPHDRWLEFRARSKGIRGGANWQEVEVLAGETSLGRFELNGEQELPQQIFIPAGEQRPGENHLTFRFSVLVHNPDWLGDRDKHEDFPFPHVAAYFRDLRISVGDEHGPYQGEIRDETAAIRLVADDKFLAQVPSSSLSYAFEISPGTKLVFSGAVQSATGQGEETTIVISARTDENPEYQSLWQENSFFAEGRVTRNFSGELDLDNFADRITELKFDALSSDLFPKTTVTWKELKLVAPGGPGLASEEQEVELPETQSEIKNVVMIILDAMRPDLLGCYGSAVGATPNIDRFAEEAVLFRNAVAPAPYTIASVSSLFSGLLPEAHGVRKINQVFPEDLENLPRAFKRSGYYSVALAGTQFLMPKYGLTRDFDQVLNLRKPEYMKQQLTTMNPETMESAVRAAAESGKPAFIYAHFLPPHWPYNPPAPYSTRYATDPVITYNKAWQVKGLLEHGQITADHNDIINYRLLYLNNLYYADAATQQMLDLLREYGLYESSLIIITSDHGEAMGEHSQFGHNTSVYEEMIRVPLLVKVPGVASREVSRQVGLIDFFPTLKELLQLEIEDTRFQGRSLAPLFLGGELASESYYYSRAFSPKLNFCLRGERYKYIHDDFREALYDLQTDPGEQNNLIDQLPVMAAMMRQQALMMIASNNALRTDEGEEVKLSEEEQRELRNLGYLH